MNVSAIVMDSIQAGLACLAIGCTLGAVSSVIKQKKHAHLREKARVILPRSVSADGTLRDALLALLDTPDNPDLASFERAARRAADLQQLYMDIVHAKPSTVAANLSKTASSIRASFYKYLQTYYQTSGVRVEYMKDMEHDGTKAPLNLQLRASHVLVCTLIQAIVHDIQMLVAEKLNAHAATIALSEDHYLKY